MTYPFLERLARGPILCDGAMGTMLHSRGIGFEETFSRLNLINPAVVQEIHQEYVRAGAEVIETNTFDANRFKLNPHNAGDQVAEINAAGVRLAREVAATASHPIWVAASVGPIGLKLAPVGSLSVEEAQGLFREQIQALARAAPDALIFETFSDLREIEIAVRVARELTDLPVIAQMTFMNEGLTPLGYQPAQVARVLMDLKVDVLGVNCSVGPARLVPILDALIEELEARPPEARPFLSVQPNAGFPEAKGGRVFYPATPEYFGDYAVKFVESGATLVGGCCGTTPNHIRAMRLALDARARTGARETRVVVSERRPEGTPRAPEPPTTFQRKLDAGHTVVGVEVDPPRGFDVEPVLTNALILKQAGADVINIADSPRAQMRMSAWAVAHLVQTEVGIESVLHFPVRGRNLLRVQGDLLAAHALRVRNLFVVMGDPTAIGDYPNASDNYDVVPSGLVKIIKQHFNRGVDHAGASLGAPCSFTVGVACDLGARDVGREVRTLRKKIEGGADFAMTQAVFEPQRVLEFLERYRAEYGDLQLPLMIGILPLASSRHAEFLHNEVPGITLSDAVRERMRKAGDRAKDEGLRMALGTMVALKGVAQGIYLMPPFGRYEICAELLAAFEPARAAAHPFPSA